MVIICKFVDSGDASPSVLNAEQLGEAILKVKGSKQKLFKYSRFTEEAIAWQYLPAGV